MMKDVAFSLVLLISCKTLQTVISQGNIARGKPTNQTGAFASATMAGRAVDGLFPWPNCALTSAQNGQPGQWWVDLEGTYRVTGVKLYNTRTSYGGAWRLRDVVVSVGPNLSGLQECGSYSGQVPQSTTPATISCDITGRFVHITRLSGFNIHELLLCEVEVTGTRLYECSLCPTGQTCDQEEGCSQCDPGRSGPECEPCPTGRYGQNCANQCGLCVQGQDCNPQDGVCSQGCQIWWADDTCHTKIVIPDRTTESASFSDISNTTIHVTWQQIMSLPETAQAFYGYLVRYKTGSDEEFTDSLNVTQTIGIDNTAVLDNLIPHTTYDIRIIPYRQHSVNVTTGRPYQDLSTRTACGFPDYPSDVRFQVGQNDSSILVSWKKISESETQIRCESLTALRVDHRMSGVVPWTLTVVNMSDTEHVIPISEPGTYDVRVILVNSAGIESLSNVNSVTVGGSTGSSKTAVIAATVVVVVLVIVAVPLLVIFLRRSKRRRGDGKAMDSTNLGIANGSFNHSPPSTPAMAETKPRERPPKIRIKPSKKRLTKNNPYENVEATARMEACEETEVPEPPRVASVLSPGDFDKGPVSLSSLAHVVTAKLTDRQKFEDEFKSLPRNDNDRCKHGQTDVNKLKNRFLNIYPYDDTRVTLDLENGVEGSDYINANYITGYYKKQEYIATQGARPDTVNDLWRMIWQEKVNRIVMVANTVEGGKKRCAVYWPEQVGGSQTWGKLYTRLEGEEVCADYTHRTITVTKNNQSRTVHQFHFTTWEDKNNPIFGPLTLFAFHRKVHSIDSISQGPLLVHCSAGVGRTGTFIAFDILVNQAKEEGQVDIYDTVQKLRFERMTMVQTEAQYIFLHDAILEFTTRGETAYDSNNFTRKFEEIRAGSRQNNGLSDIKKQFDMIQEYKHTIKLEEQAGYTTENTHKNRNPTIVPDDMQRPYLTTPYKQGNDYINAVFVSSYQAHKHYVATQSPLPDTIVDFWRLVKDQECHTIIMLNDGKDSESCPAYWPDEDEPKQRYGPFEVQLVANEKLKTIITRDFKVKMARTNKAAQTDVMRVRQFQLLSWPADSEMPPSRGVLLDLMDQVQNWQQKRRLKPSESRILVHCLDGVSSCGVYCAANHVLDKMKREQQVDAFLAARYITRSRPQFISTLREYQLLYQLAVDCMDRNNEYGNFQ